MKQKMKTILKLLFFNTILMLFGCSEELFDEQINKSNIKIQRISMDDTKFKENHKLMKSVDNLLKNQSKNAINRFEFNSEYDFFIDEENGVYIEKDNLESYTFPAYKNETDSLVTNIVFNKTTNGDYDVVIAKYNLLKTELNNLTKEELIATDVIFINITNKFSALELICMEEYSYENTGDLVGADSEPFFDWVIIGSYCFWSNSTGSGGGDSGGSAENSGGGILTSPIDSNHGGGGSNTLVSPCKKTKNQLDKYTALKPALVAMANTTSGSQENGIFIYDTATSTTPNPVQNLPSVTIAGVTAVGLPNPTAPNKYTVIAHIHDAAGPLGTGSYSIFSWQDLTRLAELIHDGYIDNDNFVFYLATADGTRYALTTEWPTAFADYFDRRKTYGIPESQTNLDYNKALKLDAPEKKYYSNAPLANKIHLTSNKNDDLIIFLKMQKELKLDFTLFEVDPSFSTYTKVSLKSDGTTIKRETCN